MKNHGRTLCLLAATALVSLPACATADDYVPPKVDTTTPTGVNLADGSFIYTETDLSIGRLSLERFHLGGSRDPDTPFFGPRMTHNFDIYVAQNTTAAVPPYLASRYKPIVHMGSAASGTYVQDRSRGQPVGSSTDAASGDLAFVGGAYIYTSQDGTIYTFSSSVPVAGALGGSGSRRVANIAYPNGRVLVFSYNASNQLKLVSDNSGYAIVFDYNGAGTVSTACGYDLAATYVTATSTCTSATLKTSYAYTSGSLTGATDVLGQTTTYSYAGTSLACIKPPGYSTCKITNSYATGSWQVQQQTLADGAVWNYVYFGDYAGSRDPNIYVVEDPTNSTSVTDPASKVSIHSFTKTSPYTSTDANGDATNYRFTGGYETESELYASPPPILAEGAMLAEVDQPEGNKYLAEYNGPYNSITKQTWVAKPGSGLSDAVLLTGYVSSICIAPATRQNCTKPLWKKDARGNETDFTYTSWGGTVSEMQPAPTSGAARPLKLYDYVQKYAYIKNAGGTLVAAASPIWLANSETDCQTVAGSSTATCDTGAPITVTTYQYGANGTADNLLPRGKVVTSGGVSLRTCYGYDARSNKISETSARAGLTVCP